MKTIACVFAALLMAGCSSTHRANNSETRTGVQTRRNFTSGSTNRVATRSGSSTATGMAHRSGSNTMNDHDKLLEMCKSMKTDMSCTNLVHQCELESSPQSCLRRHMK